jgi:hypothetical protein
MLGYGGQMPRNEQVYNERMYSVQSDSERTDSARLYSVQNASGCLRSARLNTVQASTGIRTPPAAIYKRCEMEQE